MERDINSLRTALVSVSNKEGLAEFLKPLVQRGLKVVSTGGTATYLRENSIETIDVSELTGFPEVMSGRVKTLHPKIHMCLLAREYNEPDYKLLKDYDLQPFDLVIGNLYPFEEAQGKTMSERELTEFIDIGGPSFLRAAAKSYERITVLCDPQDYKDFQNIKKISLEKRKKYAAKVFAHVSAYDAMVARKLGANLSDSEFSMGGAFMDQLRYGENPGQQASWFRIKSEGSGLHQSKILQGKPLSYNNLLDLDAAVTTLREFDKTACVAVKHLNPCGVAMAEEVGEAVKKTMQADPVSVFGGILALNKMLDSVGASAIVEGFIECVIAPNYSDKALEILSQKANLRVLKWEGLLKKDTHYKVRTISGGLLVQTQDQVQLWKDWQVIGETPNSYQKADLEFAWKVCAHLKSNAISIVSNGQTVGLGMGQVNRVDAVEQAISRQKKYHPEATDLMLASDAFFPFPDSIEQAAQAGVQWVIQPGGSIRDEQVIAKAQELGINLILTGQRHFQH